MKKLIVTFIYIVSILSLGSRGVYANEPPDIMWAKTFGGTNIDIGHDVKQTSDGGFIITGYTRSFGTMSGRNVWLIKTDALGNEEWNNAFGGNDDDEGYSVQQTTDGGYIVAGHTKSFGMGLKDVYLIKTDALGNMQWSRTFGGVNDDEGYSVQQTTDGGFIIAGVTSSFSFGGRDVWLIKTDASGNETWRKNLGGLSSDGAWSVEQTSDGGFIIGGWTFSHGPGFLGNAWLLKTDAQGNEQWNKAFGGTGVDRAYSAKQTSDGGYILTGYTSSFGAGLDDLLLIRTDAQGNEIWFKTFGGTGRDYGNDVQQTFDGGFIVTGYTLSFGAGGDDVWLVKTDANGNEEWNKTFGGTSSDIGYAVQQTTDGGFIITGHTLSFGAGVHDVWLIRLSAVIPVELVSFSGVYMNNSIELSWTTSTELNNKGFEVLRKIHIDENNSFEWESIGFINGIGTTTETNYYTFIDENPKAGIYRYKLKQIDFDGTFSYSHTIEVEVTAPNTFLLEQNYPNPFNPSTVISFHLPFSDNVSLKIFDLLGNEISTIIDNEFKEAGFHQYNISIEKYSLTSGVYFYQLRTSDRKETKKMVVLR